MEKHKLKNPTENKIVARHQKITPDFIGSTILVHNGKNHHQVRISQPMLNHRFGEFAPTRKPCIYKNKKKQKQKKKK